MDPNSLALLARGVFHLERVSSAEGGICHLYLIGTNHSTQESCRDVREVINLVKPQTVFMELCNERFKDMVDEEHIQVGTLKKLFHMWIKGKKNLLEFLYSWYLMKRGGTKKLLAKSEFKAAYEAGKEIDAKVVPGNCPLTTTLDRLWARMTITEKAFFACRFVFNFHFFRAQFLLYEQKGIDDEDIEVLNAFPPAYKTIVDEHHRYMAYNLWEEAKQCSSLVAVLERTQLDCIKRYWSFMFLVDYIEQSEEPTVKKKTLKVQLFHDRSCNCYFDWHLFLEKELSISVLSLTW